MRSTRSFCRLAFSTFVLMVIAGTHVHAQVPPARATVGDAAAESKLPHKQRLAWQIALEQVGYSPGVIDGRIGRKTELATREFQRVRGLSVTGALNSATAAALRTDPERAVSTYTIVPQDAAEVDPPPTDWIERSKKTRLGYETLDAGIAEKFHCSRNLLAELNPQHPLSSWKPGDTVNVPNVTEGLSPSPPERAASIEIDLAEKIVRVLDGQRRLVALFHCSIAKDKEKRPVGQTHVAVVAKDPVYHFDPKMWPEVKNVNRKLTIPPGPRNPVGKFWIGLALPGYGIHGTPNPEMIGKTGSHGCFRLTNWDAMRLGRMVSVGTKVRFLGNDTTVAMATTGN